MDAQQYNEQLDKTLAEHGMVDPELFAKLRDAYSYDAATTVAWVEAKLRVLQGRLRSGLSLSLYNPERKSQMDVKSVAELSTWAHSNFSGIRL